VNRHPGIIREACDPYPWAPYRADSSDHRASRALTEILDGLESDEIQDLARTFALCHRRHFEQELLGIQERRARVAAYALDWAARRRHGRGGQ
jgi:hypothetical protein